MRWTGCRAGSEVQVETAETGCAGGCSGHAGFAVGTGIACHTGKTRSVGYIWTDRVADSSIEILQITTGDTPHAIGRGVDTLTARRLTWLAGMGEDVLVGA